MHAYAVHGTDVQHKINCKVSSKHRKIILTFAKLLRIELQTCERILIVLTFGLLQYIVITLHNV